MPKRDRQVRFSDCYKTLTRNVILSDCTVLRLKDCLSVFTLWNWNIVWWSNCQLSNVDIPLPWLVSYDLKGRHWIRQKHIFYLVSSPSDTRLSNVKSQTDTANDLLVSLFLGIQGGPFALFVFPLWLSRHREGVINRPTTTLPDTTNLS